VTISQGEFIAAMIAVAFLVFITARGELGVYLRLLV
jgi:hypothetical protein